MKLGYASESSGKAAESLRKRGDENWFFKTKHIDIRVICASHRNLRELVEAGEFREDLYYRVAGITFTMPALREREDLKWLINRILAKQHKGQKESITTISLKQSKCCFNTIGQEIYVSLKTFLNCETSWRRPHQFGGLARRNSIRRN